MDDKKTLNQTDPVLHNILMQLMAYAKRNNLSFIAMSADLTSEGTYIGATTILEHTPTSIYTDLPDVIW
jgi:hypothetical protein